MANKWFETVAEAQRRAKKRLPKSVYGALVAGSERGLTLEDNITAYSELGFAPHVAGLAPNRDLATRVMGQEISFPVLISPTGVQAVHPGGEVAMAAAAAARGTAMGLSSFASMPVEDVVAANPRPSSRSTGSARGTRPRSGSSGPVPRVPWALSRHWTGPSRTGATGAAPPSPRRWTCAPWRASPLRPWPTPLVVVLRPHGEMA